MKIIKHLLMALSLTSFSVASTATAQECFRIIKFSLCNGTIGCEWSDGRCRDVTQFSSNPILDDAGVMEFIEEPYNENESIDLLVQNNLEYFNVD